MYLHLATKSFSAFKILRKCLVPVLSIFISPLLFAQVSFTADKTQGCNPLTVTFTNTSTVGNFYEWNFGEGSNENAKDPVHTYTNTGSYTVSLTVYDTTGGNKMIKGTYSLPNQIMVTGSNLYSSTAQACVGESVNFNVWPDAGSLTYDFGDGSPVSSTSGHTFFSPGTFTVSVTGTSSCGNFTLVKEIYVGNDAKPNASFSSNGNYVCPNQPITFDPNYRNGISYFWEFGDGQTASNAASEKVSHTYTSPGKYPVSVTVKNSCNQTSKYTDTTYIVANAPWGTVNITTNGSGTFLVNQTVNFSTSSAKTYSWNFGDGGSSSEINPMHSYSTPGEYTAAVTLTNGCGKDTTISTTITVEGNPVSFSASTTQGCAPLAVTFTNTSTKGNYYLWEFGDGASSNEKNPSHTYFQTGQYNNVQLQVYDTTGGGMTFIGSTNLQGSIQVNGSQLHTSSDTICTSSEANFYLWPNANSYSWNFGDGSTSTQSNVNHQFAAPGTYTVTVAANSNECGSFTLTKKIVVSNTAKPNASFNSMNEVCPNELVYFNAQDGNANSYSWNFGDGATTSGSDNVSHQYAVAKTYAVTLTLTNGCGTGTYTDSIYVKNNVQMNNNIYINSMSKACIGENINFNYSNGNASSVLWKFGDGDSTTQSNPTHSYSQNGSYTVTLKLTNGCGNSATVSKTITIGSQGGYGNNAYMMIRSSPACPGSTIYFESSDAYNHYWTFGDNKSSTQSNPSHIYSNTGTYQVSLKLTNNCGTDTTLNGSVVIDGTITPQLQYDENWGSAGTTACPKDSLVFFATGGASYLFQFGDGTSTTETTPLQANEGIFDIAKHAYANAGIYTVKLIYTNSCGKSATDSVKVTIGGGQQVQSKLDGDSYGRPCQPMNFMAFGGSTYKYYFGNGDSLITAQNFITYAYKKGGSYTVTLVVTNGCGMSATYTKQVTVEELKLSASITNVTCIGGNDGAIALGVSGGSDPYAYQWSVGAVNSSIGNLPVGAYTATVTDNNGCTVSGTYEVKQVINSKYTGSVSMGISPSPVCPNTEVSFYSAPANGHLWTFGDGSTATTRNAKHSYTAPGTYNVTLKLSSSCGSDTTVTATVVVDGSLTPVLTKDNFGSPSQGSCAKDTMIFFAFGGDHYIWNFGDGSSTTETTPLFIQDIGPDGGYVDIARHAYTSIGDYSVKLTYFNACGKSVSDSFMVSVGGGQPVDGDIAPTASVYKACDKVSLTAFGGVSYQWIFGDGDTLTTDQGTVQHTFTKGGSYKISVKITNGCGNSAVYNRNISVQEMVINPQVKNVLCNGGNTGMINITVVSGTTPYTYLWSNGAISEDAKDLKAGQYTVAVTDANGCKATSSVITVAESTVISITSVPVAATCGNTNGSISVSATGGAKPYTYAWDVTPAVTTSSLTNVKAGTYTVVVTDSNMCSKAISVGVSNSTGPAISAVSGTDETCPEACDGTLSVTATGTGVLTYSWSTAVVQTTANVTGVCPGTYVVSVKDGNNCISTSSATIAKAAALTVIVTQKGDSLSSSAATSYQWNKNGTPINGATSKAYKATASGDYSVTVKNANGCSATSVSVNVNVTGIHNDRSVSAINLYPNPTLGDAYITYELTNNTPVELTLYDCYGRHIKTFSQEVQGAGKYTQKMELSEIGLPNGIYFVCLKLNNNLYRNRISVVR